MLTIDFRGPFELLLGQAKVEKEIPDPLKLHSIVMLLMGFAMMLSSGPNPEIMLAIDFRGLFCSTFWTSKKWKDTYYLTCAKNSLFGKYEALGSQKYTASPIYGHGGVAGYALRTKDGVQPVYISPGYGINVPQALAVMRKCIGKYRIPEPTRIAHEVVNQFRKGEIKEGFHRVMQHPELF